MTYHHPDGWVYPFSHTQTRKTETGFEQKIKVYRSPQPDVIPQKALYVNERYQELKHQESQALLSEEGS
ncbi:transposase [Streptococcus gallolyticus]|uniref:Transposase n=1 Tax=Streptococcus gallolyticus TaxID=315405 RepID=A0AA94M1I7_9STRE|nr:hypothetical protein [Streptococcus gallolyticus]AQP41283.1 hypothetical protein BTR42_01420 [Streptococcus gallolyticus subsp. gallolyticus DSM 16831]SQG78564.1 transposase [Streptococcus gallolyticus]